MATVPVTDATFDADVRGACLLCRHPKSVGPGTVVDLGHVREGRRAPGDDLSGIEIDDRRTDAPCQAMLPEPLLHPSSGLGGPHRRRDVRASRGKGQDEVPADQSRSPEDQGVTRVLVQCHRVPPTVWQRWLMSSATTSPAAVRG